MGGVEMAVAWRRPFEESRLRSQESVCRPLPFIPPPLHPTPSKTNGASDNLFGFTWRLFYLASRYSDTHLRKTRAAFEAFGPCPHKYVGIFRHKSDTLWQFAVLSFLSLLHFARHLCRAEFFFRVRVLLPPRTTNLRGAREKLAMSSPSV